MAINYLLLTVLSLGVVDYNDADKCLVQSGLTHTQAQKITHVNLLNARIYHNENAGMSPDAVFACILIHSIYVRYELNLFSILKKIIILGVSM